MTLQAHRKHVPSEDMHTHVYRFTRTQLRHLDTPVPRSPVRAQTPPASRLHPRAGKEGNGTSCPSKAQSMQEPSAESSSHPNLRTAHGTWQRCKSTSNPSKTCSQEQLLLRAGTAALLHSAGRRQGCTPAGGAPGGPAVQAASPQRHPPWQPRGTLGTHLHSQSLLSDCPRGPQSLVSHLLAPDRPRLHSESGKESSRVGCCWQLL